jgi:1-deoxy-D-xylulose-5-phosphate reductoisomerase
MRTPIQYALTWPDRVEGMASRLDITKGFALNFEPPDLEKFPAIALAYDVARAGGTMGAVLNGANEAAVHAFMSEKITFVEISQLVKLTIAQHSVVSAPSLDDLLAADRWARQTVEDLVARKAAGQARPAGVPTATH